MKQFLKDYFSFSRKERNGIFVLLSILLVLLISPYFIDHLTTQKKIDFTQFKKELAYLDDSTQAQEKEISKSYPQRIVPSTPEYKLFKFDPNNTQE